MSQFSLIIYIQCKPWQSIIHSSPEKKFLNNGISCWFLMAVFIFLNFRMQNNHQVLFFRNIVRAFYQFQPCPGITKLKLHSLFKCIGFFCCYSSFLSLQASLTVVTQVISCRSKKYVLKSCVLRILRTRFYSHCQSFGRL